MAAILIRNLDDRVHAALKRQAKACGRSTEAEARRILEEGLSMAGTLLRSAGTAFAEVRAGLGGGVDLQVPRSSEPAEPVSFD